MVDYSHFSDADLVNLLKQEDRVAFTEIYNRYKGLLFVHAYKRLNNRTEAEDVIHDLFATIWTSRDTFEIFTGNLSGYLYTSIKNRVFKIYAKKSNVDAYLDSVELVAAYDGATTDHRVRENQLKVIIEKEIGLLPKKMREVFELSRNEQLSHKQIALKLDISEKTVKNHINHALKILRVRLGLIVFLAFLINR